MDNFEEIIRSCSKSDEAFNRLKDLIGELIIEKNTAEQRLNLLENAIRSDYDAILITTMDLENPEIVYVNKGFTKMTGYTLEEVTGQSPKILQGPKTDRAVLDKLKRRLEEGRAFFGHTVNYKKDGSEFINQWDIHPLTNERGEITHWVSYQHDITERKRSELKLLDTEVEFDQLVEESKKILVDVDEQGKMLSPNKAFTDFTGYDAEELKQLNFGQIIKGKPDFANIIKPDELEGQRFEFEIINKQKEPVEVVAKARVLRSADKSIIRIALENKTIQKRIVEILSRRLSELDEALDNPKDFSFKLIPNRDGNFRVEYMSDRFEDITGIEPSVLKELPFHELVHDEDVEKVKSHLEMALRGKTHTERFRMKNKGNGYTKVIDYAKPEWSADYRTVDAIKCTASTEISSEKK
ncbi:MAG: PAS domain S-box protein [Balneolaceae bacterium]